MRTLLQKQQSLPLRPVIPLVARISDQNASGAPPMTVREKTRLEKFRQLLSSHNTDLGEWQRWAPVAGEEEAEGGARGKSTIWVEAASAPGWRKSLPAVLQVG